MVNLIILRNIMQLPQMQSLCCQMMLTPDIPVGSRCLQRHLSCDEVVSILKKTASYDNPHSALQLEVQRDYSQDKSEKSG
jgi:hypothetical protein